MPPRVLASGPEPCGAITFAYQKGIYMFHKIHCFPCMYYLIRHATIQTLVQSSWSEKGRVNQIGATGSSQDVHSIQPFYTIQLSKKLINHSVCHPCTVMSTTRGKGIKLIKEKDTWLGTLGSEYTTYIYNLQLTLDLVRMMVQKSPRRNYGIMFSTTTCHLTSL